MGAVKGMVVVGGSTYRVTKLERGKYEVFRISDDVRVGTFESIPRLRVIPEEIDPALLKEIAIVALKQGKLTWQGRLPSV